MPHPEPYYDYNASYSASTAPWNGFYNSTMGRHGGGGGTYRPRGRMWRNHFDYNPYGTYSSMRGYPMGAPPADMYHGYEDMAPVVPMVPALEPAYYAY